MSNTESTSLRGKNWIQRVFFFYVDGFKAMTVGKTLWAIIAIKLAIMFLILKLIFFPDFLSTKSDNDEGKAQYVKEQLVKRDAL